MKIFRLALTGAALSAVAFAQTAAAPGEPVLKDAKVFDPSAIDRSADPCTDFYQYACGSWLKNNPIPADQASWGRFSELNERNRVILRDILEAAAAAKNRDADTQKIGDYYESCLDQKTIDARGLTPIQKELDAIDAMKSLKDLAPVLAHLHRLGVNALFNISPGQDFKDSTAEIGNADQGGLGLPERDFYFRDDARTVATRKEYVAHLGRLLKLMGVPQAQADEQAAAVMQLETAMAKGSADVTSRRDPASLYHMMTMAQFEALSDSFAWNQYWAVLKAPKMEKINVVEPDFFKAQETLIKTEPLAAWKTYLKLHLISGQAQVLPEAFDKEVFAFEGTFLEGMKEQKARWKRCVRSTDADLGEALGKAYVEKTFGADGKARTLEMVKRIEAAMGQDLQQLTWMTPETKKKAEEKLAAITNKIGYPDKWRDYSALTIRRGDALGNSLRANEFEVNRELQKIGKPVDRLEWQMTPPTINAYYDPQMNNINFPAGILQPPFFDKKADDAENLGSIGAIIGHELTHAFDDEGRQFDAKGNLEDWWTDADAKAFDAKADCLVKEYSGFVVGNGVHLNGKLTLGENTADNGGIRLAYMALMNTLAGRTLPPVDGFTTDQRFFLSYGQSWCSNTTPEVEQLQSQTDPHAIDRDRVNGVVKNMPEFQKAFSCPAGKPMVSANACRVW
ncbi:MAG TPA: M13 family metallopeptidase [Bryobacteraceae bacterium]|nr:M13 family metallopeptidase [Bryobacteraceae bacterium]